MDLAMPTSTPVATIATPIEVFNAPKARPGAVARIGKAGAVALVAYVAYRAVCGACSFVASTDTYQSVAERLSTKDSLRERLLAERELRAETDQELAAQTELYSKLEAEHVALKMKVEATFAPEAKAVLAAVKGNNGAVL